MIENYGRENYSTLITINNLKYVIKSRVLYNIESLKNMSPKYLGY